VTDEQREVQTTLLRLQTLLESDRVTEPTRQALRARLLEPTPQRMFFTPDEFALLEAVSARLISQPHSNLAAQIDARLVKGEGKGWRFDNLPPDLEMYQLGLRGLAELAQIQHGSSFSDLAPLEMDALLLSVQRGEVSGGVWESLPAARFFAELLTELTELHYSHPLAQLEIGYTGFADAHGWQQIGLNSPRDSELGP
jgi:gluconate 2-dehydrogenase gamma chain